MSKSWIFFNITCHIYICKENIYLMKDTREAMSPCFLICKRRGLDETIMKVVSKADWMKHPWTVEILHRTKGLQKDSAWHCFYFHYFNWGWRIHSLTKMQGQTLAVFLWKLDLYYSLLLYLQLFEDNHLISWANKIINGKQCCAPEDLYSLINSYLLLRGSQLG